MVLKPRGTVSKKELLLVTLVQYFHFEILQNITLVYISPFGT